MNFKQLLWRAGFVTHVGGQICIDIPAACDYLDCAERTLRRWLTGKPCPRAVKLLMHYRHTLPRAWRDNGVHFDNERLVFDAYPNGLQLDDIKRLPVLHQRMQQSENKADYYQQKARALACESTRRNTQRQLRNAVHELQLLLNTPLFLDG